MLSGMDSILTTIQNSGDAGTGELLSKMGVQIIGNYVGQYVPTIVGRVAASLDKNQRSTYLEPDGAWGPVQSAVQSVQKKLPGLREDMAVTYGNWGVPVEGNGASGFGEAAFKAVTPVYPSKQKTDAVEEEIARRAFRKYSQNRSPARPDATQQYSPGRSSRLRPGCRSPAR